MNKKLSIIKNGYDVIRITEMGAGEFKISNTSGNNDMDVYAQSLFLDPTYINFDKSTRWEISYHTATASKAPKIHMKKANVEEQQKNKNDYITLPLENLIDPDIHTEIPIPLFRIIVPDCCLKNKYKGNIKGDKHHAVIDIKDNNSIDFFLTSSDYQQKYYGKKWERLNMLLFMNDIRYYASDSIIYSGLNFFYNWESIKSKSPKDVAVETQITDNIGMLINLTKVKNLNADKLTFLFIDNSEYLTFLGLQEVCTNGNKYKAYEYDLENEKFFNSEERERWKYRFEKLEKKTKSKIKKYNNRLIVQEKKEKDYFENLNNNVRKR